MGQLMELKVTNKNEQLAIRSLTSMEDRVVAACARGLKRALLGAVKIAQFEYLSGPRPGKLQAISGRLRDAMDSEVTLRDGQIIGRIWNNVKYAAFHEFGFHGVVNVSAHTRVISNVHAGGELDIRKRALLKGGEFLGFLESRKRASARQRTGFVGVQFVKSHRRQVDYGGKPFARPALEQSLPMIIKEITSELETLK